MIDFYLNGRSHERYSHFFVCFISAWSNMKLSREIEDRRRLDQIQFERAGTAPIVRTYKFDPTKIKKSA